MPEWSSLAHSLPQLTLRSVVDILVVTVVIYQLLRLVRGTHASQVLYGLLLLVLGYYLARWWQLTTLHWLLTTLLPYFALAIIVLFQAEIRKGLAELGGAGFLGRLSTRRRGGPYEDVALAASRFSQEKTGALIVLERRMGLRTHVESGIALDARLSYDLLLTIFQPGTPLHDGAAIVQKDRLAAAACFLPLSVNPERSREFGSRHRAALGITEDTDAVAVVVSEHNGAISLAFHGAMEQGITAERLRERLGELFGARLGRGAAARLGGGVGGIPPATDARESVPERTPTPDRVLGP